jgi:hypothetical protein
VESGCLPSIYQSFHAPKRRRCRADKLFWGILLFRRGLRVRILSSREARRPYSLANTPTAGAPAYKFVLGGGTLNVPVGVLGAADGSVTLRADVLTFRRSPFH